TDDGTNGTRERKRYPLSAPPNPTVGEQVTGSIQPVLLTTGAPMGADTPGVDPGQGPSRRHVRRPSSCGVRPDRPGYFPSFPDPVLIAWNLCWRAGRSGMCDANPPHSSPVNSRNA